MGSFLVFEQEGLQAVEGRKDALERTNSIYRQPRISQQRTAVIGIHA